MIERRRSTTSSERPAGDSLRLEGKRVLVVGLGVHGGGVGVVRFLVQHGAQVVATDLATAEALAGSLAALDGLPVRYVLGEHRLQDLDGVDMVVRNPAVPAESPFLAAARQRGIQIEMEMGLFFRRCPARTVGVTGTKGKTTTTLLIASILGLHDGRTVVAGNLRLSALELLPSIESGTPTIIELSSWQLEGLEPHRISPNIGVLTNITPDHLNRYASFADYAQAKATIVRWQSPDDVAVLNRDDAVVSAMVGEGRGQPVWFSRRQAVDGVYLDGTRVLVNWRGRCQQVCDRSDVRVPGEHNVENVLAACAAAIAWGVDIETVRAGVQRFSGVEHRLEFVRELAGVRYYNDTAATAPAACMAALHSFDRPIVLIAGGADKNIDFADLGKAIATRATSVILLEGTATDKLARSIAQAGGKPAVGRFDRIEAAVAAAQQQASSGDVVLLSPGCASFGMFKNEFDRGEKYKRAVLALT
jgi:UDP-N-acetylmuramoylalanine--D-glutamate ligase